MVPLVAVSQPNVFGSKKGTVNIEQTKIFYLRSTSEQKGLVG